MSQEIPEPTPSKNRLLTHLVVTVVGAFFAGMGVTSIRAMANTNANDASAWPGILLLLVGGMLIGAGLQSFFRVFATLKNK